MTNIKTTSGNEIPISIFASALRMLLDDTGVFTRDQWSEVLGVSTAAISQWVNNHTVPRAVILRSILDIVKKHCSEKHEVLQRFYEVARQPAGSVSPLGSRMLPTVAHYMVTPVFEGFQRVLNTIQPDQQEQVLFHAAAECRHLREVATNECDAFAAKHAKNGISSEMDRRFGPLDSKPSPMPDVVASPELAWTKTAGTGDSIASRKHNVLIIDDNAPSQDLVCLLEEAGHNVIVVDSGHAVVELLEKARRVSNTASFDIIFVDARGPDYSEAAMLGAAEETATPKTKGLGIVTKTWSAPDKVMEKPEGLAQQCRIETRQYRFTGGLTEHLDHCHFRAIFRCLGELYVPVDVDEFPRRLVENLSSLVSSDFVFYGEMDPDRRTSVDLFCPAQTEGRSLWPHVMNQHPPLLHARNTGDLRAYRISDFISSENEFHRTMLYNEFYRSINIEDALCKAIRVHGSVVTGCSFQRDRRSFTDQERLMFELVGSHLTQILRNVEAMSHLQRMTYGMEEALDWGMILLRPDGSVNLMTSWARSTLERFFGTSSARDQKLPEIVNRWMRKCKSDFTANNVPSPIEPFVVEHADSLLVVRLHLCPAGDRLELQLHHRRTNIRSESVIKRETEVLRYTAGGEKSKAPDLLLGIKHLDSMNTMDLSR